MDNYRKGKKDVVSLHHNLGKMVHRKCVIVVCLWGLFTWTHCQSSDRTHAHPPQGEQTGHKIGMGQDSLPLQKIKMLPIDTSTAYVMGHFEPAKDSIFTEVHIAHADRPGLYLRKDTYAAFQAMDSAAREEGIQLQIRSATRNFEYQKSIWERKWTGETPVENGEKLNETTPDPVQRALKILRYSSMPGSSRHHWGTDIDLNNFTNRFFEHGEGLKIYTWLVENAPKYGFRQPYTAKDSLRPEGYNEEKWHWSFYPVSDVLTEFASRQLEDHMITGFMGAETATQIGIVKNYVLGINPDLLPFR